MIAKKSFGQHFLHDQSVIKKIIVAAEIKPGETVLEVGPGHGVLTQALVAAGAKVIAVEADRDLIPELQKRFGDKVEIVLSDILKFDFERTGDPTWSSVLLSSKQGWPHRAASTYKLVANLPYNIATAVIEKFLSAKHPPTVLVVMVQKEVADRMMAKPGDMSVLSVACQIYADLKRVTNVGPGAFNPPPKVDSTVVRLSLRAERSNPLFEIASSPVASRKDTDKEAVIGLAKAGFRSRRKLLKKNLEGAKWSKEAIKSAMDKACVDEMARAQELSVDQWVQLWYNLA